VILFIEEEKAATSLNSLLTANGMPVTRVCSGGEFLEAIELRRYDAVITRTYNIGTVCRLTQLPILNVEKFVFTTEQSDGANLRRRFDHQAFLQNLNSIAHGSLEFR
jgi:hypothetical protein